MNSTYSTVSVIYPNFLMHSELQIAQLAIKHFSCLGVQEYSYVEAEVDKLLGERSYSGGDLTEDIFIDLENDAATKADPIVNFYFENKEIASEFQNWLHSLKLNFDSKLVEKEIEDWNAYWRESYDIIHVFDKYRIVPSWKKEINKLEDIYIYPGMGFGTGNHETTFLCLQAFYEHELTCREVLDFGCGSGILGIGTIKKSLETGESNQVDFYDIDAAALANCEQNLKLNELEVEGFPCLLPESRQKIEKEYDLVFANILKHVLIEEKSSLASYTKPSGHLVLSGILNEQVDEVLENFLGMGFKHIQTYRKNDWSAILLQRV